MKMNKRGDISESPIVNNLFYFIFFLLFFVLVIGFGSSQRDGAAAWEDFYAKEIVRIIDGSQPGSEVFLDVTKGVDIALKRDKDPEKIVNFDNVNNRVIVSLKSNSGTSFSYFNDVDVVNWNITLGSNADILYFKIVEAQK